MKLLYAVVAAACATLVSAHGVVIEVTAGGQTYDGPGPLDEDGPAMPNSPIRRVAANGPVTDVTSDEMACGKGTVGELTGGIVEVAAGDEMTFKWTPGWIHEEGPVTVYMGKCPASADVCDGTKLKWFKIDARGYDTDSKTWYQGTVIAAGKPGTAKIPEGLQEGDYLVRYEILALHRASLPKNAEFFISCTQVKVVNGGDKYPSDKYLTTFPGAYKEDDPGILVDIYTFFTKYDYPGPELWKAGDSDSAPPASPPDTGDDPAPPPEDSPDPTETDTPEPPVATPPGGISFPPGPVRPPPPSDPTQPPILNPNPFPPANPEPLPTDPEQPEPPTVPTPDPEPTEPEEPEPPTVPLPDPEPTEPEDPQPTKPPKTCKRKSHRRRRSAKKAKRAQGTVKWSNQKRAQGTVPWENRETNGNGKRLEWTTYKKTVNARNTKRAVKSQLPTFNATPNGRRAL